MMASCADTIARLDALSRQRALSLAESLELERAIRAEQAEKHWRPGAWDEREDRVARYLRRRKLSYGQIARVLKSRSENAVAARLRYLEASR